MSDTATTRQTLIEAAGTLFAEQGFDATSTRAIAERGQVNLGAIHHHFGGKRQLYLEAFRQACRSDEQRAERRAILAACRDDDPVSLARAVVAMVASDARHFLRHDRPTWHLDLIAREAATPSTAQSLLIDELFRDHHRDWLDLHTRIHPGRGGTEAHIWALQTVAQLTFFHNLRTSLAHLTGQVVDDSFLLRVVHRISRQLILDCGLPLPEDLR